MISVDERKVPRSCWRVPAAGIPTQEPLLALGARVTVTDSSRPAARRWQNSLPASARGWLTPHPPTPPPPHPTAAGRHRLGSPDPVENRPAAASRQRGQGNRGHR